MTDIGINMKVEAAKAGFFDRYAVLSAMSRAKQRVLSRAGAMVRTRAISLILRHIVRKGFGARSKIKNRAGASKPGEPPFSHTGLLVKFLFFAWDAGTQSVVVGPARLNRPGNAPRLLEFGGTGSFMSVRVGRRGGQPVVTVKRGNWRPRPYMRPALAMEQANLAPLWQGSIRKAA